jgi:nucleotide-binding universal stress UspA family protein
MEGATMTIVLAAIDGSPVSSAVLETARTMAVLMGAGCHAVHVREPARLAAVHAAAAQAGLGLELVDGTVEQALIEVFTRTDVVLGVVGVRDTDEGPLPAGHTTLGLLRRVRRPVVAVPPAAAPLVDVKRVLLPLDGEITTTRAVEDATALLAGSGAELVVLHSFTPATAPAFWNGAPEDQAAWGREFLARHCATMNCRLVLRTGPPGRHVVELATLEEPDLLVLGWSQNLSESHAAVVRTALSRSPVPILLLPTDSEPAAIGWPSQA